MTASDEETKKLSAPKFSSFKPKQPATEPKRDHELRIKQNRDDKRADGGRTSSEHHSENRSEHRSEHRSRHRRHESHRRKEHRRSGSRDRQPTILEEAKPVPRPVSVPGVFVIDTKGDPLITKYGGIDRAQIPAYYRHGSGRVLGTTGRLVIHRDGPRDQFSLRMPGEGSAAYTNRDGLRTKLPLHTRLRRIKAVARDANALDDETEGYLPIVISKKHSRDEMDLDSTDGDEPPSYRSIEGKAKRQLYSDDDSDDGSDTSLDHAAADRDNPLRIKSMELNKRVKEHPEDIDTWLELVDHQDALLRAGQDIDHTILENEAHSYSEIKVSMLESAISNTSKPEDRNRILVYLMREGVKVWSSKVIERKWAEVLADEDDNFDLWITHLDFLMSNISVFQYDSIMKKIMDRLRLALSRPATKEFQNSNFQEAIYVFLRATRFIHNAGYKELAVGAWQGLLELNLFRPLQLIDEELALDSFQNFWESEVPRIGDVNAQGWRQFVAAGELGDAPEPVMDEAAELPSSRDTYESWGNLELFRAQKAAMPARTMDDGTEDDPFRVVMFSDIKPFLFFIPDVILPVVTRQLVDAFLIFAGLPPAFRSDAWTNTACCDQFLTTPLDVIETPVTIKSDDEDIENAQRKEPRFDIGRSHIVTSPSVLFASSKWFHFIPTDFHTHIATMPWIMGVLKLLVHSAEIEDVAVYFLSLCLSTDLGSAKKTAKALLKRYPANSELYNAYALAEFANNDIGVATKVLASTTGSPTLSANWYGFLLFKTWSWIELMSGNTKMAIKRSCSSVDETLRQSQTGDTDVSLTVLLKAQQTLASGMDGCLLQRDPDGASVFGECLILLAYLTAGENTEPTSVSQGNISAAMTTTKQICSEFELHGQGLTAAHERVLQFAAQVLYFNASNGPFRRVFMREQLIQFIEKFPRNSIFLSLFEWSDASLRIIDETRDLLHDKVLVRSQDCVSARVFAIQHELARGNVNTTKAAYEHALSSDVCKASPMLWISYIRFCYLHQPLRTKAKEVFYRALRQCPGSKDVMMESFRTLIRDMESEELRAVYNTMSSKGLRVHVDLEEFLEQRRLESAKNARR